MLAGPSALPGRKHLQARCTPSPEGQLCEASPTWSPAVSTEFPSHSCKKEETCVTVGAQPLQMLVWRHVIQQRLAALSRAPSPPSRRQRSRVPNAAAPAQARGSCTPVPGLGPWQPVQHPWVCVWRAAWPSAWLLRLAPGAF